MTAQELKNSILQLAVQGKLVPQDPNDESASELLKRIRDEKERLVKEGKIKKDKAFAPITEDEIPFDIPENWEWVRLGLNYNIIIDTALILEAESEDLLHNVINQYERLYIKYYQPDLSEADKAMADNAKKLFSSAFPRLKDYSSKRTGMKHYIDTFKMLIPESDLTPLKTYDEAIQVLYQFRNVIAHGRAIRFEERTYYTYPDYENESKKEIDFMGGYRKTQEYLIKKGLLAKPVTETHDFKSLFSDKICDHLINVESDFFETWKKCVPFDLADYREDYEKLT